MEKTLKNGVDRLTDWNELARKTWQRFIQVSIRAMY